MSAERAQRKLAAILSADVKDYSRLMEQDELGTVTAVKECRALFAGRVHEYRGRIVDSPGDNILAEFASVVDAVECALKIQAQLRERNAPLTQNRRMEFRIGINLGDVIEDGERIYGDGVNIAARVESLAEAGETSRRFSDGSRSTARRERSSGACGCRRPCPGRAQSQGRRAPLSSRA